MCSKNCLYLRLSRAGWVKWGFFGDLWDKGRGMDGIRIKLIVKLCSGSAVYFGTLLHMVVSWKDEINGIDSGKRLFVWSDVWGWWDEEVEVGWKAVADLLAESTCKPHLARSKSLGFPCWVSSATAAGGCRACPALLQGDQGAPDAAAQGSSAAGDGMSPLIFVITKCNSDIHRQEVWQQWICDNCLCALPRSSSVPRSRERHGGTPEHLQVRFLSFQDSILASLFCNLLVSKLYIKKERF